MDAEPDLLRAEMKEFVFLKDLAGDEDFGDSCHVGLSHLRRKQVGLLPANDVAHGPSDALRGGLVGVEQRSLPAEDVDDVPRRFRQSAIAAFAFPQFVLSQPALTIDALQGCHLPLQVRQFHEELLPGLFLVVHNRGCASPVPRSSRLKPLL